MSDKTRPEKERERIRNTQARETALSTSLAVFVAASVAGSILGGYAERIWFGDE